MSFEYSYITNKAEVLGLLEVIYTGQRVTVKECLPRFSTTLVTFGGKFFFFTNMKQ